MKVLLLNTDRFYDAKGGTEKVLCNMANAMTDRGHQVEILFCENKIGTVPFELSNLVKLTNVGCGLSKKLTFFQRLRRLFILNKKNRHAYDASLLDPKFSERIKPALIKSNPDVIVCFQIAATRILKSYVYPNCPIVTMFHFNPDYLLEKSFDKTLYALEKCEYVQVLLKSYINITKRYINTDNVVYIPNVVPQFNSICSYDSKKIINVGRFSKRQKRQHLLIEAFNKIVSEYPDWSVEFWGEADEGEKYYRYCKELVNKYKLNDKIIFCGTTNNIYEELKGASVFVFPSAYEGFPLALTEAMSIGLPSIGFKNCPAVNELIKDSSNGILCDEKVEDLADSMRRVMSNRKLREEYGINAKKDMVKYAPDNIWNMWEALLVKTVKAYKEK